MEALDFVGAGSERRQCVENRKERTLAGYLERGVWELWLAGGFRLSAHPPPIPHPPSSPVPKKINNCFQSGFRQVFPMI